jgi:L-amino acid N-acyltransferase YncA
MGASVDILLRAYEEQDLLEMIDIWNEIIEAGNAFPQTEKLTLETAQSFFALQTYTGVAVAANKIVGLYILHPNGVGHCAHIANASYAVKNASRGKHIGERLVEDCMRQCAIHGFRVLQFNAVVCTNAAAIHLYEKLGFTRLGDIPGGYRLDSGEYVDISLFYMKIERSKVLP